jgi:hypothetical protein
MSSGDDGERNEGALRAEIEHQDRSFSRGAQSTLGSERPSHPRSGPSFCTTFWHSERGGTTTLLAEPQRIGIEVPSPAALSDEAPTDRLREIIHALASLRVFLERTNLLSDRALYEPTPGIRAGRDGRAQSG